MPRQATACKHQSKIRARLSHSIKHFLGVRQHAERAVIGTCVVYWCLLQITCGHINAQRRLWLFRHVASVFLSLDLNVGKFARRHTCTIDNWHDNCGFCGLGWLQVAGQMCCGQMINQSRHLPHLRIDERHVASQCAILGGMCSRSRGTGRANGHPLESSSEAQACWTWTETARQHGHRLVSARVLFLASVPPDVRRCPRP